MNLNTYQDASFMYYQERCSMATNTNTKIKMFREVRSLNYLT